MPSRVGLLLINAYFFDNYFDSCFLIRHSLEGQMAPLERTASGGVTDWRAKPTEKENYEVSVVF